MLTVLLYDERLSSMITEYRPFWDPFLSSGEFAVCKWRTQGRTVADALPDLYDTVGEEGDWRAVVLYHSMAEVGSNPFDFFEGTESAKEVEENALIRLTHMLSVVPHRIQFAPVGVKKNLQEMGESSAAAGEEESSAPAGAEASPDVRLGVMDKDYIQDRDLVFEARDEDKDYYSLGESNYEILCARPNKIVLVATRKKNMSEELLHGRNKEKQERCLKSRRGGFCDRNDYPANVRFLIYDTWYASTVMGERDQFILMHAMMTLLMNESAVTLRSEEVYRLLIQIDEEELEHWLMMYQEKMNLINNRIRMVHQYLEEERENRRDFGTLPDMDVHYYVDLAIENPEKYEISERPYKLYKDVRQSDEKTWRMAKSGSQKALASLLKEPLRKLKYSLDNVRQVVREEEQPVTGRFTKEQLEDAQAEMEQLERGMFQGDATPAARLNEEERDECEGVVEKRLVPRMNRRIALVSLIAAALLFYAGFLPFWYSARKNPEALAEMILIIAAGLGLLFLIWLLFLIITRKRLHNAIRSYNKVIAKVVDSYRRLQKQYQDYVTRAFNYRKYWHFVRELQEDDDKFYVDQTIKTEINLLRHKSAADRSLDLCSRVRRAMNIQNQTYAFYESEDPITFGMLPEESGYYELSYQPRRPDNPWADETCVYYGYEFVSGFGIKREEWNA